MVVKKSGCVGRGEAHDSTFFVDVLAVIGIVVIRSENC